MSLGNADYTELNRLLGYRTTQLLGASTNVLGLSKRGRGHSISQTYLTMEPSSH